MLAAPADALTRKQADAIAMRVLHPTKGRLPSALFGLPKPVEPTQSVAVASMKRQGLQPGPKLRAAGRRVWVYWLDLAWGARFEHPGKVLLVDDATGVATRPRATTWYPLIDGRRPPYLRTPAAYFSAKWQVWSSARGVRRTSGVRPAARPLARELVPRSAFADDCLIMYGPYHDPNFQRDFLDMGRFARSVGIRTWYAASGRPSQTPPPVGSPPEGDDLRQNVGTLVADGCKDVMIYLDGHGSPRYAPSVSAGDAAAATAITLDIILLQHPETTFKVKIDACYSGRWLADPDLKKRKNLLVLETASAADEPSWSALPDFLLKNRGGEPVERQVDNPGRGEFTHGNLIGMLRFVQSDAEVRIAQQQGGSMLVHLLTRAFELGAGADGARVAGLTHPGLRTAAPAPPPPPTTTTATLTAIDQASHTHPSPNPGFSYVCDKVTATAGATISFSVTGPSGFSGTGSATLPSGSGQKDHVFTFKITQTGKYDYTIGVSKGSASKTLTGSYTVPSLATATGPFACPPP